MISDYGFYDHMTDIPLAPLSAWEPTPWPPEVRACAVPDVLPVFLTAIGAVVATAALVLWVAQRAAQMVQRSQHRQ